MKKIIFALFVVVPLIAFAVIGPFPGGSSGGGGSGTVTSVGMSMPSAFTVTGSPVTGSGSLDVTYSGTAIPVANGGTGATTLTSNNVVLGNGASAVQFVAPGTSGNVLTSNGTTWTSAAPAGGVTGSGTADRLTKWSSSSAVTSSLWAEGATNGELQFQNYASAKGTAGVPLVDLAPGTGAGLFTDNNKALIFSANGAQAAQINSSGALVLNQSGNTSNTMSVTTTSSGTLFAPSSSVTGLYTFRGKDRTSDQSIYLQDSNGNNVLTFDASGDSASVPGAWIMSSYAGRIMQGANLGVGFGGATSKWNKFTISANGDQTNVRGTTTVNASTTITGSSTKFTTDFGIGDYIAVSSAGTTYSRITAIASDTSMTVATAVGDGTSQTMNKKQSPFRVSSSNNTTTYFMVDYLGRIGLNSGSNGNTGQATCNGTTEVTVNNTNVTASSKIFYSPNGATTAAPWTSTRTAGTSFGFKCGAGDTATVDWMIVEPF